MDDPEKTEVRDLSRDPWLTATAIALVLWVFFIIIAALVPAARSEAVNAALGLTFVTVGFIGALRSYA